MNCKGESALSQTPEQLNQGYATREVSCDRKEATELQSCNLKFHSESARKKYKTTSLIKKTKIKEEKTSLDLSSLATASEKYLKL